MGPHRIISKRNPPLIVKTITKIGPITRWFKIVQYYYKKVTTTKTLVETMCLIGTIKMIKKGNQWDLFQLWVARIKKKKLSDIIQESSHPNIVLLKQRYLTNSI